MKKIVGFICTHNSCRSQMAEGFANELGSDVLEAYSAGTQKYPEIKPLAITIMKEENIDISHQKPKLLEDIPGKLDILVTMGCGVSCPYLPCEHREDWGIEDPSGKGIDEFRKAGQIIKEKVIDLVDRIRNGEI